MEKKRWTKPECVKVRLVPEEAVLWGCKTAFNAIGPGFYGTCFNVFGSCPSPRS